VLEAAFSFPGFYIFAKFRLEKYDFESYKGGFFMGKMAQICRISNLRNSKLPEAYDNFQKVAKNIEGFYCFFKKRSDLLYSQILPYYIVGDHHFGYITKSLKETLFGRLGGVGNLIPSPPRKSLPNSTLKELCIGLKKKYFFIHFQSSPFIEFAFCSQKTSISWALSQQGRGLLHWMQLWEVLCY